jgi:hypothetical protein
VKRHLDYLFDCAKLNNTPYVKDFALISRLDEQSFAHGALRLDGEQFSQFVRLLQGNSNKDRQLHGALSSKQIALNLLFRPRQARQCARDDNPSRRCDVARKREGARTKSKARTASQNAPRGMAGNMAELIERFGTE